MRLDAQLEALCLFLAPEPVTVEELRRRAAGLRGGRLRRPRAEPKPDLESRGLVLRQGGRRAALASHPDAEEAARRLLARPRTPALTPAQAETLAIVAYLQPVSRPEVARIRGVASESARPRRSVERGLIEEAGRSQFGAVLYRTTRRSSSSSSGSNRPRRCRTSPSGADPEEATALRERLLRAGEARGERG